MANLFETLIELFREGFFWACSPTSFILAGQQDDSAGTTHGEAEMVYQSTKKSPFWRDQPEKLVSYSGPSSQRLGLRVETSLELIFRIPCTG